MQAIFFSAFVVASGPYKDAIERLSRFDLPKQTELEWQKLISVAEEISAASTDLSLTVDPIENRGFEYHCGVTFSVFSKDAQRELGRGGRYTLLRNDGDEPATGATLLVDSLLDVMHHREEAKRLYVPFKTPRSVILGWQDKGWRVVSSLGETDDAVGEARRLRCKHILAGNDPKEL